MQWHRLLAAQSLRPSSLNFGRCWTASARRKIQPVPELPSWDMEIFQGNAFQPAFLAKLPSPSGTLPPACHKWFIHNDGSDEHRGISSELNLPFWAQHSDLQVPIELTQISPTGKAAFHRSSAPLKLFLEHSASNQSAPPSSLYIAQCPLASLSPSLQSDLPTPSLVTKAGKGDIYDSSLWMGRPPTFTPLHKDPNPNLFLQLAGQKVVRVFPPDVGRAMFDLVQVELGRAGSASFRGEEMMQGAEREQLEEAVWAAGADGEEAEMETMRKAGFEARLGLGEALFIPKGWWHSVRGVGKGMNASVNWWFR